MSIWLVLKSYMSKTPFLKWRSNASLIFTAAQRMSINRHELHWAQLPSPWVQMLPVTTLSQEGQLSVRASWKCHRLQLGSWADSVQDCQAIVTRNELSGPHDNHYSFWILNPREVNSFIFSMVMIAKKLSMWHISCLWFGGVFLVSLVFVQNWPKNCELERSYQLP